MHEQIWRVCLGHLLWVSTKPETRHESESNTEEKQSILPPHRWVSGEAIVGWDENYWLPTKSLSDTPFQIIKAGEFFRVSEQSNDKRGMIADRFRYIITSWVRELGIDYNNALYAFPRSSKEIPNKFYFADHVLIWWAIKSVEDLGLGSELYKKDCSNEVQRPKKRFSSHEV